MRIRMRTIVVDCADAHRAADFYGRLLGWERTAEEPDWVLMRDPSGGIGLSFQAEEGYMPPVWPEEMGAQSKMLHMDFVVDDLKEAAAHAIACGATRAARQYYEDVLVMLDPDGHPFCLFTDEAYTW